MPDKPYKKKKKPAISSLKDKKKITIDDKQNNAIVHLSKKVKAITTSEPKYIIAEVSNSNLVNSTPTTTLLNGMAVGDTNTTRHGNRLKFYSIEMRIIINAADSLQAPQPVRFMLVRKIKPVGATITISNLLSDSSPDFMDNFNVNNIEFKQTYKVYWDKSVVVYPVSFDNSATGTTAEPLAGGKSKYCLTIRTKLGGFITNYGLNTAGDITDIDTNGLFLISFTDNSTASAIGFFHRHVIRCNEF